MEILKSTLLQYEKSNFFIDLIQYSSNRFYINMKQVIEKNGGITELKINSAALQDIISVLQTYQKQIQINALEKEKSYLSGEKQQAIIDRYLKGVPLADLCIQFDYSQTIIEHVIISNGLQIVDNKLPKQKKNWYRMKK